MSDIVERLCFLPLVHSLPVGVADVTSDAATEITSLRETVKNLRESANLRVQYHAAALADVTAERDLLDKGHSSVLRAFGKLVNEQRAMTTKPKQGRPPKPADQQTKPYSIRLTEAEILKLKAIGMDRLRDQVAALEGDAGRWRMFLSTRPPNTHAVIKDAIDAALAARKGGGMSPTTQPPSPFPRS